MKSIKEYTRFVLDKAGCSTEFTDEDIDTIMFSYGWKYNQEV